MSKRMPRHLLPVSCARAALLASLSASLLTTSVGCGPTEGEEEGPLTLDCDELAQGMTLEDRNDGVDYIVTCLALLKAPVTIKPGVTIEFAKDAGISADGESWLNAVGTAQAPITLRGQDPKPGSWRGLYFGSDEANNVLEHVQIAHGGGLAFNSNDDKGNIILYSGGRLTVKSSTLRDSGTYGMNVRDGSSLTFESNTITGSAQAPLLMPSSQLHKLDGASKLTGNTKDFVVIFAPEVGQVTGTWRKLTVPYLVELTLGTTLGINNSSKITIEPGVEMRFSPEHGMSIDGEGSWLTARGTEQEPIRFLGLEERSGSWRGLYFGSDEANNVLDYVEIAHGGGDAFNSNNNKGGIIVYSEGRVTLSNSIIRQSPSCGVSAEYAMSRFTDGGSNTFEDVSTPICLPRD